MRIKIIYNRNQNGILHGTFLQNNILKGFVETETGEFEEIELRCLKTNITTVSFELIDALAGKLMHAGWDIEETIADLNSLKKAILMEFADYASYENLLQYCMKTLRRRIEDAFGEQYYDALLQFIMEIN
jgi:hypothetical protein